MTIPEHAHTARYGLSCMDDMGPVPIDINFAVSVSLSTGPEVADATARTAVEAAVAYLREAVPTVPVHAYREYLLSDPGDPWPPPPAATEG